MRRHLDRMIEVFGEPHGCRLFRKVAPWYARRFGPANRFNKQVVTLTSRAQFEELLNDYCQWRKPFLDETGQLQPRFQPPPLIASFLASPVDSAPASSIPVPKGPIEIW
jgi:hypothetical protein